MANCGSCGPGYASPKEAFYLAPKEKILYIPCIIPDKDRPDYLSTVDVDPASPTYQKVSDIYIFDIYKKLYIYEKTKYKFKNKKYLPYLRKF